jgi:PKD repeat protein
MRSYFRFIPLIALTIMLAVLGSSPRMTVAAQAHNSIEPELPRVFLDTTYIPPSGSTIYVNAGGDLQAALNAASPGSQIVLESGATFTGNFTLPAKSGNSWITVRTSNLAGIPAEGTRVLPQAHASSMPKIVTRNNMAAMTAARRAGYYRFIGVEFTTTSSINYNIIRLGDDQETDANNLPSNIILDRCYIHGIPTGDSRRGVTLNSRSTAIIDSHISEIHQLGADTQAIGGWNGPGPYKIANNYLEAAGENLMLGGADPAILNNVPSDVEIRRNYFAKPLRWKTSIIPPVTGLRALATAGGRLLPGSTYRYRVVGRGRIGYNTTASSASSNEVAVQINSGQSGVQLSWGASEYATSYRVFRTTDTLTWHYYDVNGTSFIDTGETATGTTTSAPSVTGTRWTVKNLFELKIARRVLVDGNVFENSWKDAQIGYAILLKSTNSGGNAPWAVTEDVTFTNNLVRHAGIGISLLARGGSDTLEATRRVKIENNLFDDISSLNWGGTGNVIQLYAGYAPAGGVASLPPHVIINHNTFFGSGYISVDGPRDGSGVGFVFTNNIVKTSSYGIKGSSTPSGDATLNTFFNAPVLDKNVFIGARSSYFVAYRNDNYFHTDPNTVGFVDYAAGVADHRNYILMPGSSYSSSGLHPAGDGSNRGVDIAALDSALYSSSLPPSGNQPPEVTVTVSSTSGVVPLSVDFSSSASDPDGQIVSYNWSFGDGGTSSSTAPTHVYTRAGVYSVRLTVADNAGATASAAAEVRVLDLPNQPPQVTLLASATSGTAPLTVSFSCNAVDSDGFIVAYNWSFGDGSTSSQVMPSYVYKSPGVYTATVTVTDNLGLSASASTTITVTMLQGPPAVHVQSPNGGERLRGGSTYNISWSTTGSDLSRHDIELSLDGGLSWSRITSGLPGTARTYPWRVPSINRKNVRIRVTAYDVNRLTGNDMSDSGFVITN